MPFTLVHPVAVLWLARGPLSMLALVSGAVAPDLPYFLRVTPLPVTAESWYEPYVNATASHSLGHLLSVALPLAVVVYLCGILLVPPLRSVAGLQPPSRSRSNFSGAIKSGVWIVISLLIGVLTHLAWDALTESAGSWSRLLQHSSTVLGLLILLLFLWRRRRAIELNDATVRRRIAATAALGTLVALAGAMLALWSWRDPASDLSGREVVEGVITSAVKGAGASLVAAALVLAIAWWVLHLARSARDGIKAHA